ncbi:hypothetical protein HanXRQr2_Chr14g0660171 [Helianthus annuus]|uniref:Uncharacterized protein n=1 Tax=Helianthus annuus TaxID=4232 RepID=A0A9K3H968_HELAN|nr:hypothetical protein HanXRQr2_Chr14g0660171 [Helianthus annuus]KAJ0470209.1 hypothetical protein HanIR_Chr14g0716261 [Helianthus annuus]
MTIDGNKYNNDPKELSILHSQDPTYDIIEIEISEPQWKAMWFAIDLMTHKRKKEALSATLKGKTFRKALSRLSEERKQRK